MLISFEGLPGAGKTTQAGLLAARLRADGYTVTDLPDLRRLDDDTVGQQLVHLLTASPDPFLRHGDVLIDTFLAAAVRAHLIDTRIRPALATHDVVIEDRGAHTMYSYSLGRLLREHDMAADAALDWLRAFSDLTGPVADRWVWLRPSVPVAIARWSLRDGLTPTGEQRSFLAHVDAAYDQIARRDPTVVRVDVGPTTEPVHLHQRIYTLLHRHLPVPTAHPAPLTRNPL